MHTSTTGFVALPGVRLSYETAGAGKPIVFLNGGFVDSRMWDDQVAFFAQQYHTVRYDMRASGKTETEASSAPFSHYHDLHQLLQSLAIPRATLIGLSLGARTAIDFAITYPDIVARLILISPSISGYEYQDAWVRTHYTAMLDALAAHDLAAAVEEQVIVLMDGPARTPEQVDPVVRERIRAMVALAFPLSRLAPNARELEPPALGRLAEIHAPTWVILGDKDAPDTLAIGTLLHDQIVGSQLVTLADVGHTLVMEQPAAANIVIGRCLRG